MHAVICPGGGPGSAGLTVNRKLAGVSLVERHLRALKTVGVTRVSLVGPAATEIRDLHRLRGMEIEAAPAGLDTGRCGDGQTPLLVLDMNVLIDPLLMRAVAAAPATTLLVDSHPPPASRAGAPRLCELGYGTDGEEHAQRWFCGMLRVAGTELRRIGTPLRTLSQLMACLGREAQWHMLDVAELPTFQSDIRRKRRPVWLPCHTDSQLETAKRALIDGAQKGSLDWPAQWIHAPIENRIVAALCETRITPNQVTLLTNIAAWAVTLLFWHGYIVAGLIGAAVVGVLDGLDGKLARVKLMTSRVGEFEHIFDLVFEYSWWFALGWSLSGGDPASPVFAAAVVLIVCNLGDSLATVSFLYWRGRHVGRTLDNYTRTDFLIRKIAGRRNVYVWIMLVGVAVADPLSAFYAATAWAMVTLLVRGARAWSHLSRPLITRPVDDFLS